MAAWAWFIRRRTRDLAAFVALKFLPDEVARDPQALEPIPPRGPFRFALGIIQISARFMKSESMTASTSLSWNCWKARRCATALWADRCPPGATLSPDGRCVAATTVDGQTLLLFDVAAQKWSELAKASVNAIRWSSDGKYVHFDTQSNAEPAVHRARTSDRKLETVASLRNLRRVIPPFQSWMGLRRTVRGIHA